MASESLMDQQFLQSLSSLLDAHLGEEYFGVKELAREVGLSKSQLLRKLQALKGKSTSQYIREYRLERAMDLLQQGEGTASEIAYRVGFSSPTYFNTCFHECFGYPPGEVKYRNYGAQEAGVPSESPPAYINGKKRLVWLFALGILLVVATSFIVYLGSQNDKAPVAAAISETTVADEEKSIGVLPFTNLSGDPDLEYISDGMTDAIINKLTKIKSFQKVVPFTTMSSFKNSDKGIAEIAGELGVTHLLEGNVQKAGDTIKVVLRLIDGKASTYAWSEDYKAALNNDEFFQMQAEVAENVARNMDLPIKDSELYRISKNPTSSSLANKYFMQAEYLKKKYEKDAFERAIPLYENAIKEDSSFAQAYLNMARLWQLSGWMGFYDFREAALKGREYLAKMLEIDPGNLEIADEYFFCKFLFDWNFEMAEPYFQKRLANNSLHESGQMMDYANKTNRNETVLRVVEERLMEEPNNETLYSFKARALWLLGRPKEALEVMQESSYLYFNKNRYNKQLAKILYSAGDYHQSMEVITDQLRDLSSCPDDLLMLAAALSAKLLNTAENEFMEQLLLNYNEGKPGSPAFFVAGYYSSIGELENAISWLQKSYDNHEVEMTWLNAEPFLEPVKDDPRYKELWHKVGFSKVIKS